jgi:hypothetical protein
MELEGDRQKARRLATGVKSRGQPFAQARPGSSPDGNEPTTKVLWNIGVSDQPTSSDTRACAQGKVIRVANIKPE